MHPTHMIAHTLQEDDSLLFPSPFYLIGLIGAVASLGLLVVASIGLF